MKFCRHKNRLGSATIWVKNFGTIDLTFAEKWFSLLKVLRILGDAPIKIIKILEIQEVNDNQVQIPTDCANAQFIRTMNSNFVRFREELCGQ